MGGKEQKGFFLIAFICELLKTYTCEPWLTCCWGALGCYLTAMGNQPWVRSWALERFHKGELLYGAHMVEQCLKRGSITFKKKLEEICSVKGANFPTLSDLQDSFSQIQGRCKLLTFYCSGTLYVHWVQDQMMMTTEKGKIRIAFVV